MVTATGANKELTKADDNFMMRKSINDDINLTGLYFVDVLQDRLVFGKKREKKKGKNEETRM